MKIHTDNTGAEIDAPKPEFPAQSLAERMNLDRSEAIEVGELSEANKAILSEPQGLDRREFDYYVQSGLGLRAAFEKAAAASGNSSLYKSKDFQAADEVLRDFQNHHDKKSLSEQLEPLVQRAVSKLSKANAELLRKAWRALDLSIISFLLGKAFAQ